MARIFYGVMGDARGHISRALTIAREMPQHEFLFAGGGKFYRILQENGYQVENVPITPTVIRNHRVDIGGTVAYGVAGLARMGPAIKRVKAIIREYDPDLIISDYEFVTMWAARMMGRPCVSLDNQHLLTECRYDLPPGQRLSRYLTCFLIRYLFSGASHYLITSFHRLPPADPAMIEVFPPLIKAKVKDLTPSIDDHVLVYLRGNNFAALIERLKESRRRVFIYGLGEKPPQGNLIFKNTSEDGFLTDLASCRYVITTGGHSLISEALYLEKPLLCLPVHFFYEQYFNAYFLSKNNFGHYLLNIGCRENFIEAFEGRVSQYRAQIKKNDFLGNPQVAARLEELSRG